MGGQRNDPTIIVDKKMFEKIVADSDFLDCLEACGVDNWVGYSQAVEMFKQQQEELDKDELESDN